MSQAWHIAIHFCAGSFGTLDKHQADAWRLFDDHSIFSFEFACDTRAITEPPRCSKAAITTGDRAQSEKFGGVEQSFEGEEIVLCAVSDHDNSLMIRSINVAV